MINERTFANDSIRSNFELITEPSVSRKRVTTKKILWREY